MKEQNKPEFKISHDKQEVVFITHLLSRTGKVLVQSGYKGFLRKVTGNTATVQLHRSFRLKHNVPLSILKAIIKYYYYEPDGNQWLEVDEIGFIDANSQGFSTKTQ